MCNSNSTTDHDLTIVILAWVISLWSVLVSAPLSLDVHVHVATVFFVDDEDDEGYEKCFHF